MQNAVKNREAVNSNASAIPVTQEFGSHSYALQVSHPGYRTFRSAHIRRGTIFYTETPDAWVGAADPFCQPSDIPLLVADFMAAAKAQTKDAILVPVRAVTAKAAKTRGYETIEIGSQLLFRFSSYCPQIPENSPAFHLYNEGAEVREISLREINAEQKQEIDSLIASTKFSLEESSFLNASRTWELASRKKYFCLEKAGEILGFLSASPIPAQNGWAIFEVSHRDLSGSRELLVLETLKLLKASGARGATIACSTKASESKLPSLIGLACTHLNLFSFAQHSDLKKWLSPSQVEPLFLLSSSPFGFKQGKALGTALLGQNPFFSIGKTAKQRIKETYAAPNSVRQLRATASLVFSHLLLFFALQMGSTQSVHQRFSFSLEALSNFNWAVLFVSPFLHQDGFHLLGNLLLLGVVSGSLEVLAGSRIMLATYFLGTMLINPLTAAFLLAPLSFLFPQVLTTSYLTPAVSAVLGPVACLGAVLAWKKQSRRLVFKLALGLTVFSAVTTLVYLSATVALLAGFFGIQFWRSRLAKSSIG